jgi:hypothetical protein
MKTIMLGKSGPQVKILTNCFSTTIDVYTTFIFVSGIVNVKDG